MEGYSYHDKQRLREQRANCNTARRRTRMLARVRQKLEADHGDFLAICQVFTSGGPSGLYVCHRDRVIPEEIGFNVHFTPDRQAIKGYTIRLNRRRGGLADRVIEHQDDGREYENLLALVEWVLGDLLRPF
jgi:hypothetical protein